MDFKGIAWADNIYEKFEAMCLEVEEVMRQDTVKYVENQVQKVGISVKKLYSEIMQDFLPPSGVDPLKVAAGDLSLSPCSHSDMNDKSKAMLVNSDLKKESTEDKLNADEDVGKKLSLIVLGDKRDTSLLCNLKESCVSPSDHTNVTLSSDLVGSCNSVDTVIANDSIIEVPGESSTSNVILSVDCARQNAEASCCTSSSHPRASESISMFLDVDGDVVSQQGSNISSNKWDITSGNQEVITFDEGSFEIGRMKVAEDKFDIGIIHDDEVVDSRADILKQYEKSNLEESCVMVERDMLHFFLQKTAKQKSFKKKIREAFLSKLMSRKPEYNKLLVQYGNQDGMEVTEMVIPGSNIVSDKAELQGLNFSDSDWELL